MDFTVNDLLAFAQKNQDQDWRTLRDQVPFSFTTEENAIVYVPFSGKPRKVGRPELESFCDEFKSSGSFEPGQYDTRWHKSYTLPLIQAMLREKEDATEADRTPRSNEMILTAYFLAKYTNQGKEQSANTTPPAETAVTTWEQVYKLLYPQLNDGRDEDRFKQSLYGSIFGIGSKLRKNKPLQRKEAAAVKDWEDKSREALWAEVSRHFNAVPPDSPRVTKLKAKFQKIHPTSAPPTPTELRKLKKLITVYERPGRVTAYVKRTRGDQCQVCREKFFIKRNGLRYCEVHHIFWLSKNPPPECLSPEYLVAVCANCHRMMHYADVGEPERTADGWRMLIGSKVRAFKTS